VAPVMTDVRGAMVEALKKMDPEAVTKLDRR
jgi:hypothetical protein